MIQTFCPFLVSRLADVVVFSRVCFGENEVFSCPDWISLHRGNNVVRFDTFDYHGNFLGKWRLLFSPSIVEKHL